MLNSYVEINLGTSEEPADESEAELVDVKGHSRNRGKRNPLPANLPRERVEHDLSDDQKVSPIHQQNLVKIGEKISEELEIIPASMKVVEHVTFSYKCPCCSKANCDETILTSKAEPRLIPGSMASANLVAYIAISKYQDGLPLYRQEAAFKRLGIDFSRTTLARWMMQASDQTAPPYQSHARRSVDKKGHRM